MKSEKLSEIWDGKDQGRVESDEVVYERTKNLIKSTVKDSEMSCGGRRNLDARFRGDDTIILNCGSCAVRKSCAIGLGRKA